MKFTTIDDKVAFANHVAFLTAAAGVKHNVNVFVTAYSSLTFGSTKTFIASVFEEKNDGMNGRRLEIETSNVSELDALSKLSAKIRKDLQATLANHQEKIAILEAVING